MKEIIISPSILSADFANLERDIKKVELSGAQWVHIDVMDGHFVPNITIGAPVVMSLRKATNLKLDVHLMIENPQKYIPDFIKAGADIITFHYEAVKEEDIIPVIDMIKSNGVLAGISIKPNTFPNKIFKYLEFLDMVLVMTVEPGFGGQKFMDSCANKLIDIKSNAKHDLILQVDGGINSQTAKICVKNGATSLVAGSYVFKSDDIEKAISLLKQA